MTTPTTKRARLLMIAGLSEAPSHHRKCALWNDGEHCDCADYTANVPAKSLAESYRDAAALGLERCRMRRAAIVRLAVTLGIWEEFQQECERIDA